MTDIKRLNYFTNQFLVEKDFKDEQAYFMAMRRRHNQLMHTWGVADGGLLVAKVDNHTLSVGAGMALDANGEEIVVLDTKTVDLTPLGTSTTAYVTLQYKEGFDAADHYTSGGLDNYIRITEYAVLNATKTAPPNDGSVILLATATLDNTGAISSFDQTVRRMAGSNLDPTDSLQGSSLLITGPGVFTGKLAIGGTGPAVEALDVRGNVKIYDNSLLLRSDANHGIGWFGPTRQFANTAPDGPVVYGFSGGGLGTTHAGQDLTVFWNDTNVGIGTVTPDRNLTINNPNAAYMNLKDGTHEILMGVDVTGGIVSTMSNHDLVFRAGSNSEKMRLTAGGNVGIGTPTPAYGLDVKAKGIKLGLEANGGGQLILANNPNDNRVWLEAFSADGTTNATEFLLTGRNGGNAPQITLNADKTNFNGAVRQGYLNMSGGAAWSSVSFNSHHATGNWVFPDTSHTAVTLEMDDSGGGNPRFQVWSTSKAAPTSFVLQMNLDCNTGNLGVRGAISAGGGKGGFVTDQFVNTLEDSVEQGDVLVISSNESSLRYGQNNLIPIPEIDLAQKAYDTRVCGIVSEVHREVGSSVPTTIAAASKTSRGKKKAKAAAETQAEVDITKVESGQVGWMVTLGAFAQCKVDADIAPVEVGDLLTTSPTKGYAQKVLDPTKAIGAILGKALGALEKGKGLIPVIVIMQ